MTAPGLSPAEQATVDRFEAAEAAPESWRPNRAARNATCCEHAASDHDTHGCAVNLSTHSRTYERCHGLVTARPVGDGDGHDGLRSALRLALAQWSVVPLTHLGYIADALLPVVTAWADARARERAAEELRAAAGNAALGQDAVLMLLYRADALAADDRTGQR